MRLIAHLKTLGLSGRAAKSALESGKIWYRDAPTADPSREVAVEHVRYLPSAPRLVVGRDPAIVYRDDQLVSVWKPAGLLAVPAKGRYRDRSLIGVVGHALGEQLFAVHRLDEHTSGLMVIARTAKMQRELRTMFAAHRIERRYLAIVRGRFPGQPITLRTAIVRDRGDGLRGTSDDADDDNAKEAITHLTRLETFGSQGSLVEARLETGRTHQIRIHLAELGHPVIGDGLYGGQGVGRLLHRYALHAYVLGFRHPGSGQDMRFEAPLADDLERYARRLRQGRH